MIIMIQKNWMHFLGIMRRPRNKPREKKAIISPNKKKMEKAIIDRICINQSIIHTSAYTVLSMRPKRKTSLMPLSFDLSLPEMPYSCPW